MKLYYITLCAFAITLLTPANSKAQANSEPNGVLVYGEITGEGRYSIYEKDIKGLFIKLTVTNVSASEKHFLVMSCSWMDNWQTDNRNLTLFFPGCDKNVPESITLKPQKSIVFYGFLTRKIRSKDGSNAIEYVSPRPPYDKWTAPEAGVRVRFGFTERYPNAAASDSIYKLLTKYESYSDKTWWSQPVSLQFDNSSFLVVD